jgi:hypothetical protein
LEVNRDFKEALINMNVWSLKEVRSNKCLNCRCEACSCRKQLFCWSSAENGDFSFNRIMGIKFFLFAAYRGPRYYYEYMKSIPFQVHLNFYDKSDETELETIYLGKAMVK